MPDRETVEAYALGTLGAVQGVYKYYIRPELTAGRAATLLLFSGVILCARTLRVQGDSTHDY